MDSGVVIGNYRLIREIARGGMGTVYEGEHVALGRRFAVKILADRYARDPSGCERFLNEARSVSQIRHANVIDVTDFGQTPDGRLYFVMELFRGQPLSDLITVGEIPLFRTLGILGQVALALDAAHQHGVIHRDLKPGNVLLEERTSQRQIVRVVGRGPDPAYTVEPEGKYDFVKVIDFGIAKFRDLNEKRGVVFGTPAFMAPEQIRGQAVDARTDVYALGVLFFEMLTGQPPFDGGDARETCEKHLSEPPPLPRLLRPDLRISEATECVILKALAKDPARRHQSMTEMYHDLQTCFTRTFYRRDAALIPGASERGIGEHETPSAGRGAHRVRAAG